MRHPVRGPAQDPGQDRAQDPEQDPGQDPEEVPEQGRAQDPGQDPQKVRPQVPEQLPVQGPDPEQAQQAQQAMKGSAGNPVPVLARVTGLGPGGQAVQHPGHGLPARRPAEPDRPGPFRPAEKVPGKADPRPSPAPCWRTSST